MFAREKPAAQCLSSWQLSRITLEELPPQEHERAQAHLQECQRCAKLLAQERALLKAAVLEPIPSALAQRTKPKTKKRWWLGLPALGALAALLFIVKPAPNTRSKGATSLSVTVMRKTQVVQHERALEQATDLRVGDRLRLKVVGPSRAHVSLQGWENGDWRAYFEGPLPKDRWLPLSLRLTDDPKTRLRLQSCDAPVDPSAKPDCHTRVFELKVGF